MHDTAVDVFSYTVAEADRDTIEPESMLRQRPAGTAGVVSFITVFLKNIPSMTYKRSQTSVSIGTALLNTTWALSRDQSGAALT